MDHVDPFLTSEPTHLRVGWACTEGYHPRPTGGDGWGGSGVGDCLHSYGFDGLHLWSGEDELKLEVQVSVYRTAAKVADLVLFETNISI